MVLPQCWYKHNMFMKTITAFNYSCIDRYDKLQVYDTIHYRHLLSVINLHMHQLSCQTKLN